MLVVGGNVGTNVAVGTVDGSGVGTDDGSGDGSGLGTGDGGDCGVGTGVGVSVGLQVDPTRGWGVVHQGVENSEGTGDCASAHMRGQ